MRLNPTPADQLCDAEGRPSFLWDNDLTLAELRERLASPDLDVAAYWLGTTMRQAKPDDALTLATVARMRELWPRLERYLGKERAFWKWLLYRRYVVEDGAERTIVDVVAEPVVAVEPPIEAAPGIFIDSRHEILVNKLTALLGRSAIRDLVDVSALLESGQDLDLALTDAARKDGGFSPPTLAWLLDELPVEALARSSGLDPRPLLEARALLVKRLLGGSE